jgi:lipopolysaccharide export system ATP-binding protein
MTTLSALGISKSYNSRKVVDDVHIHINKGEIVGLFGPNGAGKTTTFYMIIGFLKPNGGKIMLNNEDITDLPMFIRARKGITYLPQEPSVFKKMSVEDNLRAILEFLNVDRELMQHKILEILESFNWTTCRKTMPIHFPEGERRSWKLRERL